MGLAAGTLDRRITLHFAFTRGVDAFNAPIEGPPPAVHAWASYTPASDRERLASGEVAAEITARFVIRWSPDVAGVSPGWWLTFEGRTFDILGAKEIGRREGIEITASARAE